MLEVTYDDNDVMMKIYIRRPVSVKGPTNRKAYATAINRRAYATASATATKGNASDVSRPCARIARKLRIPNTGCCPLREAATISLSLATACNTSTTTPCPWERILLYMRTRGPLHAMRIAISTTKTTSQLKPHIFRTRII